MPKVTDSTSIWWRDGFPGIVEEADWRRVIKTGNYWFLLDTDALKIPRLGSVETPISEISGPELTLQIEVDGKIYQCKKGGDWSRFTGPRVVESGRFFQRSDVTDLEFVAEDGTPLNVDARFEFAAWPDQLGLSLHTRPGFRSLIGGEKSFGRVHGGFGLDGTNRLDFPAAENPTPENFTLCFWVFMPSDFKAAEHSPWLVSKNKNELGDGAYGILLHGDGVPEARLNLGGGKENMFRAMADRRQSLKANQWNHLALSYDGKTLSLIVNGNVAVEETIEKPRSAPPGGLTFGSRQDGSRNYDFRGVVDEIYLFDKTLALPQIRSLFHRPESDFSHPKPVRKWSFDPAGKTSLSRPREDWKSQKLSILLSSTGHESGANYADDGSEEWKSVDLTIDPLTLISPNGNPKLSFKATDLGTGENRPVTFEDYPGWHRINLDGIKPIAPEGQQNPSNDAIERIRINLENPTDREQIARLMFEKTARGFQQKIGTPITGITAMLRNTDGNPTGIPVQLSKNWHVHPEGGAHSGQWFHGISQVRLPAKEKLELELTIAYGHWGGVAAASHAQLSLIGWGNNQLWDQSALGSWGESICYEPEQGQANSTVTDMRPVMVTSMSERTDEWNWTKNVGGADFFRLFDKKNQRVPHSAMRANYHRTGPCLTEVTYSGGIGKNSPIHHSATVSLARRDDVVVGTYRIKMEVKEAVDFSRLAIFQTGADTYATTQEKKLAVGNKAGLISEWPAQWGGNVYRGKPIECIGDGIWASLHETNGNPQEDQKGAWANRGFVIRKWKAVLGGKPANPWIAERGLDVNARKQSSTLDLIPPPGTKRLEPGDFVEATVEHVILPQFAADYYGPNIALRDALTQHQNTWKMVHRHAAGDALNVDVTTGTLRQTYPGIQIAAKDNVAEFTLEGGLSYVPIVIKNLSSHRGFDLLIDGEPLDQSVHGNDFWQTDYDPQSKMWSQVFNVPADFTKAKRTIRFQPKP